LLITVSPKNQVDAKMLNALIWLLGYQLAGEFLSRSLSLPVPGAVLGMLLLFLTFCVRKTIPDHLKQTVPGLLRHLSLLFIPAGVGLLLWRKILQAYALPLVLIVVVSTLVTWVVSATLLHALQQRGRRPGRGA
jgi:holin-like protein